MVTKYKVFYVATFLILGFNACKNCHEHSTAMDENKIRSVLDKQTIEWNKGNIKGFMYGYDHSDSMQFITKRGRTTGWQNVLDRYTKSYPTKKDMGELHFKNLIIKNLSDSLAQVYGQWEVLKDSTSRGNFSLVMKNKPEGWRIIIDHTW